MMMMMMMVMICSSEGSERGGTEGNWASACVCGLCGIIRGPVFGQRHVVFGIEVGVEYLS